jgi:hypothetical protein
VYQQNLFGAPARSTGFVVTFHDETDAHGPEGLLVVRSVWAKRPSSGRTTWQIRLAGDGLDALPELMAEVYHGWNTTQPQHSLPRALQRVAADQDVCEDQHDRKYA